MKNEFNYDKVKEKLISRKKEDTYYMAIYIAIASAVIALIRPKMYLILLIGLILGITGTYLIAYDLKKYKLYLLKLEVYKSTKTKYKISNDFSFLHFQNTLDEDIKNSVERYVGVNLKPFTNVINKSNLQIIIVTEPLEKAMNDLFSKLGKKFKIDEEVNSIYVNDLDYIVIRYFGLPIEGCIGHEFTHFLIYQNKDKLLTDTIYEGNFEKEKEKIFTLSYQQYFKEDLGEFSAELGSLLISSTDIDTLLKYDSTKQLLNYINKYKNENYTKRLLG